MNHDFYEISMPPDSINLRICDCFVFGFGLWTVLCHLTVFTEGSLFDLMLSYGLTGALLLYWKRLRRQPLHTPGSSGPTAFRRQRVQEMVLWGLVMIAVGITLAANRPDPDDCRYINRAVTAAEDPDAPILQRDTMHLIAHASMKPSSKVISNEMLAAALSWGTHVPPIYIFHLLFPPVMAILMILAYGELFKILSPTYWAYGVLGVMIFLIANGEVHRTYGNFSFVRLHQGKGVLVSVLVPLLIVYGLRFANRPSGRNWLLLGLTQITAVGMSSSALLIAPVVAVLSVFTGVSLLPQSPGRKILLFVSGTCASWYVIALGAYIQIPYMTRAYTQMVRIKSMPDVWTTDLIQRINEHYQDMFTPQLEFVFGHSHFTMICALILLTAWVLADTRIARRLCLVFPIALGILVINPFAMKFLVRYLTNDLYWRVFWMLPLPVMAGIVLLAPLSRFPSWIKRLRYGGYALLLLLLLTTAMISDDYIFSESNGVTVGVPGLKVPPEYQVAGLFNNFFDDRPNILAPEEVALWLPTMPAHPYPLVARLIYANSLYLPGEANERTVLVGYLMGAERPENAPQFLSEGLQRYQIAGVCVPLSNPWIDEIRTVLHRAEMTRYQVMLSYEIWVWDLRPAINGRS